MRSTETPKPIWTKFCILVDITDTVTYTNFGDHRLKGFLGWGQISPSPVDFHRRPYNTLALPCELVITMCLVYLTLPTAMLTTATAVATVMMTWYKHRKRRLARHDLLQL